MSKLSILEQHEAAYPPAWQEARTKAKNIRARLGYLLAEAAGLDCDDLPDRLIAGVIWEIRGCPKKKCRR